MCGAEYSVLGMETESVIERFVTQIPHRFTVETKGNVFIYDVLGLECKAFKILSGSYFDIYAEFTNEIVLYIK